MVSHSGEERQINGINGHNAEDEQVDLQDFDAGDDDDEVQAEQSFFSQNPFSQQLNEKKVVGVTDVQLNE